MTRPKAAAERFVAMLSPDALRDVEVILSPLVQIVGTGKVADLRGQAGVIFTSANAVTFAPDGMARAAYCVGEKTAAAASERGWDVKTTQPHAEALIDVCAKAPPKGPLVHLCGHHRRGRIAQRLTTAGMNVTEQVLYDQPLCPLSDAAQNAVIGELPCVVPLFSPRTAAQFATQVKDVRSTTAVVMSDAVARKLGDMAFIDMIKAQTPTGDEMARCVEIWLLGASLA